MHFHSNSIPIYTAECGEYDGLALSECTQGFSTLFHMDRVLRNTDLDTRSGRQVLVPSINFSCSGNIRKWILGARWLGNSLAHTELQIWRKISNTTYTKVAGTSIIAGTMNSSKVYEQSLELPISFQAGDILGYFQPIENRSELSLFLEDSHRMTMYYQYLSTNQLSTPQTESVFSISNAYRATNLYPLITVITGIKKYTHREIGLDKGS